jgi:hypothetical protein
MNKIDTDTSSSWKRQAEDASYLQINGRAYDRDIVFWEGLQGILEEHPHSLNHILGQWPAYTRRVLVMRFLAHYELFKMCVDLPGSIVELGVARGASFFSFHKFLEIFCPTDTTKKVYGFDSFEGLTDFCEKDGRISEEHDKRVGGWSSAAGGAEVMSLNDLYNKDSIIARERGQLIKGRVQDTLPTFLAETPGLRISLLHFDMDLYDPTMFALKALWDLVVSGGVVVFDEYGLPPWGGETNAFDEFCRERNLRVHPRKFNWCYSPTAYIVKD